jgi:LacI family transcriptional regulator
LPTISDVAKEADVSPATVSRVIQGATNVRPTTRERVERAIEELGYVPSAAAQSLRSRRTRSLALVVSDITNTFWTTVARGVEDEAQRHGYSVLLCNTDENLAKQLRYLDLLIGQQVDGVIIAPFDSDARHLDKLRQRNIPTVLIDRRIKGWDVDSVSGDSVAGARALVQHLIGLGHKRIAVVSGPENTSTAEDRITGYRMALAEADIPINPRLIRRGEYRSSTGEEITHQLLQEGLNPTAIFATNNAIAIGVINALEKQGLRIPQDVALVSFDDLPNASHLFPFLTVVAQPAYDMGVNAAQLLFSRLDSGVDLRPRHVVLPSRLFVRHSCGSKLKENGRSPLSLPISKDTLGPSIMVRPLSPEERRDHHGYSDGGTGSLPSSADHLSDYDKSNVDRLLTVLKHREADRVPHIEFEITSKAVYEYVLEHGLDYDRVSVRLGAYPISPEDHVEFALRLGMDAVPCNFFWRPRNADLDDLEPPPSLTEQLSYLERYLRAAQGTGVGVIAGFSSFFDTAMLATGIMNAPHRFQRGRTQLGRWMDAILANQEKVMRVVCDRFGNDLALVVICDNIAHHAGLMIPTDLFMRVFQPRMARLIAPAKEHGKLLLLHTGGKVSQLLPILRDMGFDAVHPIDPSFNDIYEVRKRWQGKLAIVGNVPTALLARGDADRIEARVRDYCMRLAPGGGYVLSSSGKITEDIPAANFVAMTMAVHKFGRYRSLGSGA